MAEQSRTEEILRATIDGDEYTKTPQSREEELLLELKQTIEGGGGASVVPNPEGEATETLTKLGINDTVYGIPSGGGDSNTVYFHGYLSGTKFKLSDGATGKDIYSYIAQGKNVILLGYSDARGSRGAYTYAGNRTSFGEVREKPTFIGVFPMYSSYTNMIAFENIVIDNTEETSYPFTQVNLTLS